MQNNLSAYRIILIVIVTVVVMGTWWTTPYILAATGTYATFEVPDSVSIVLQGSDDSYTYSTYTIDSLLASFRTHSPELQMLDTTNLINEKTVAVIDANIASYESTLHDYQTLITQATADANNELITYYQGLYNQTLIQKASAIYQQSIIQYQITNKVQITQYNKTEVEKNFLNQVYRLISLEYQRDYYNALLSYQQEQQVTQKIRLVKEKILQSEYETYLNQVSKTQADIQSIENAMDNIAQYIRKQTNIDKTQDITLTFDLRSAKTITVNQYNGIIDSKWANNPDLIMLAQKIIASSSQREQLFPVYPAESSQSQLSQLEIDRLQLEKSSLKSDQDQKKLESKNQFISVKAHYDIAISRAITFGKIASEKRRLYDLDRATKLDLLESEVNMRQANYEVFDLITQLLSL